jgi:hypothetical protein
VIASEKALRAHRALLNGSGKLAYFSKRGLKEETVRGAYLGYEPEVFFSVNKGRGYKGPAFMYPCIAREGGLLGLHYKSETRNGKGKRWQRWDGFADDLPLKGHGKKPHDPAKIIPFGMETLKGLDPGSMVILFCGEEDALSGRQVGFTSVSQAGAGLLEPAYAGAFAGLEVIVFYDAGEEAEAHKDALTLLEAGAAVRVVEWPADTPSGMDVNDRLVEDPDSFKKWLCAMIEGAKPPPSTRIEKPDRAGEADRYAVEDEVSSGDESEQRRPTQSELLVGCTAGAGLFHTPAGDAYAAILVGDHRETHPIRAKGFRRWVVRAFFEQYGRPPGAQALQDALGLLEARAQFDGPEREVYVRVAEHNGNIYVDLANERWEAVEISADGWHVVSDPPVRFRRPRGMVLLPTPAPSGRIEELRKFISVADDSSWYVMAGWLIQALRPRGPYPVLILQGEQGSAKSTAEHLLRALVDPSTAPLRTTPRNERDLIIAATNSWCVAFDNISTLPPWTSDALCRLSTGGGFSARELYTDSEEVLFDATRPVILNGITDVATRPDLLDRSLIVTLPPIPDDERKSEAALWREFEQARPAILGALFDAVSGALGAVESVRLEGMPRMADFAVWITAAENALGWEPGAFTETYTGNRQEATESALEADPVAAAVRQFMQNRQQWTGTATELWKILNELVDEDVRHTKAWPAAPNSLTNRLKRLAPALRGIGIDYEDARLPGGSRQRVKRLRKNTGA